MATPYEWAEAVAACVVAGVTSVDGASAPGRVEYGNMSGVASADCCPDGYLFINFDAIQRTGEQWPNPAPLTTPMRAPSDVSAALSITAEYRTCVPVLQESGAAPDVDKVNASAERLWGIGYAVWNHAICCVAGWANDPAYGPARVGSLIPRPRNGGCSGFDLSFTVKLPTCPECE